MTLSPGPAPEAPPPAAGLSDALPEGTRAEAEELVLALVKTLRIRTLYQPNNPIYREFSDNLVERFQGYLASHQVLRIEVKEHELCLEDQAVYRDEGTRESLPFSLHRDGIREITFFEGLEPREIFDFLETVKLDPTRDPDQEDVLSRLWEKDFVHVRYLFVDLFLKEEAIDLPGPAAGGGTRELGFAPVQEEFRVIDLDGEKQMDGRAVLEEQRLSEVARITPDDFDPTLYFLERDEVRALREEIEHEKDRNLLLDLLGLLRELVLLDAASDDVDPLAALEELQGFFLIDGNLATVVHILDVAQELERAPQLSHAKRAKATVLAAAALSPESLRRVAELLEESETDEGALAAYLERAARSGFAALVERLGDLKRLAHRETLLAPLVRAAGENLETLHQLFRHPDPGVVKNAIFLSGRAASRQSLEALEEPLRSRDAEVRIEAINALKTYRSARAMDLMVAAIGDPDKLVRYYALRNLISFNYRPAVRAVTAAIESRDFEDKDLTERKLLFEAFGRFAGEEALPSLTGLLGKRGLLRRGASRDVRICVATALGEIGGPTARALLQETLADRDPEVRAACERALARVEP
jgi:HEAT repeat protein